jgi:hypothetical protein
MIKNHLATNHRVSNVNHGFAKRRPHSWGVRREFADWVFYFKFNLADGRTVDLGFPELAHNDHREQGNAYTHWFIPVEGIDLAREKGPDYVNSVHINVDEGGWLKFLNLIGAILSIRLSPLQLRHGPITLKPETETLVGLEQFGWEAAGRFVVEKIISDAVKSGDLPPLDQWDSFCSASRVRRGTASGRKQDIQEILVRLSGIEAKLDQLLAAKSSPAPAPAPKPAHRIVPKPAPNLKKIDLTKVEVLGEAIGDMAAFQDNHL